MVGPVQARLTSRAHSLPSTSSSVYPSIRLSIRSRVHEPELGEGPEPEPACVAPAAGGTVDGRVVAGAGQAVVHAELPAAGDDLRLREPEERCVDSQPPGLDPDPGREVRHPLEGLEELR